jgi:hypothetical protein
LERAPVSPYLLLLAVRPAIFVTAAAVLVASAGYAATLPLQEHLLELTPDSVRGQVQGVESAGRMTWQGLGAAIAGGLAQVFTTAVTITLLSAITIGSRPLVVRARVAAGGLLGR